MEDMVAVERTHNEPGISPSVNAPEPPLRIEPTEKVDGYVAGHRGERDCRSPIVAPQLERIGEGPLALGPVDADGTGAARRGSGKDG